MPETILCGSCSYEYSIDEDHRCYDKVDVPYIVETILYEFFIQCALCHFKETIGSVLKKEDSNGWYRMKGATQYRGYVCQDCRKKLKLP